MKKFSILKTTKEIKSFLGLIGYYRRFIENFPKIIKPITNCLKKGQNLEFNNSVYKKCYEKCKTVLSDNPILQYPNFSKEFILTTNASNYAIGAVLSQRHGNNKDLPIAYISRTLHSNKINYSTTEKELLAIKWATKQFRPYLLVYNFKIVTDHRPFLCLNSFQEPNSKLIRRRLKLQEFNYNVEY